MHDSTSSSMGIRALFTLCIHRYMTRTSIKVNRLLYVDYAATSTPAATSPYGKDLAILLEFTTERTSTRTGSPLLTKPTSFTRSEYD